MNFFRRGICRHWQSVFQWRLFMTHTALHLDRSRSLHVDLSKNRFIRYAAPHIEGKKLIRSFAISNSWIYLLIHMPLDIFIRYPNITMILEYRSYSLSLERFTCDIVLWVHFPKYNFFCHATLAISICGNCGNLRFRAVAPFRCGNPRIRVGEGKEIVKTMFAKITCIAMRITFLGAIPARISVLQWPDSNDRDTVGASRIDATDVTVSLFEFSI